LLLATTEHGRATGGVNGGNEHYLHDDDEGKQDAQMRIRRRAQSAKQEAKM